MKFEIIGEIFAIETIAAGTTRLADGTICEAELHWYEAHGIGKKEFKFKKPLGIR